MRTEYSITDDTGTVMARAATRYRLARPAFWVPIVVELVLAGAFAAAGHPLWAAGLVVVAALAPALLWLQTGFLGRQMTGRGYRPGTVLAVDWDDETFTVVSGDASGTHRYEHATGARVVGDAVVLRIRGSRVLLALPAEVVPDAVRPRLRLAPSRL